MRRSARRQLTTARTGSYNDVLAFYYLFFTIFISDLEFTLAHKFTKTHYYIDLIFSHQELYALAHFISYSAAAFHHSAKVSFKVFHLHAIVGCVIHIVHYLGGL